MVLIVAGLCEVGFTYCLGRAKGVAGTEWWSIDWRMHHPILPQFVRAV